MVISKTNTKRFRWLLFIGILQLAIAVWFCFSVNWWMSIAWIGVSVSTFFRAFDEHRQIWDIEHEDDRYTIMRNNVLQFAGSVDDVFAITVDSQIYTIYPKEGRKAYIPRGIFEEGIGNLYHEYRSRKQSEIDSTGASSPIDTPVGSSKTHIKSC